MKGLLSVRLIIPLTVLLVASTATWAIAQEGEAATVFLAYYAIDNIVLFFCAVLVLLMQPGFALLETGLWSTRS